MRQRARPRSTATYVGRLLLPVTIIVVASATASGAGIQFRSAFDDSPLDVSPKAGETLSPAVQIFHQTGRNPYRDDDQAIAGGKRLYMMWCQGCHNPDANGRIGPSLIGDSYLYDRVATDVGMFEIIYGGAAGAMQSFKPRMSQDEMLRIIAYVRSLKQSAAAR